MALSPRAALGASVLVFLCSSLQRSSNSAPPAAPAQGLRGIEAGFPVWHPHEFVFETGEVGSNGGVLRETTSEPFNPWLNWRFSARFHSPSGEVFEVPGFYAGDAAGSGVGDAWKVRFAPDRSGVWKLVPRLEYANTALNVEPLTVPGQRTVPLPTRFFRVAALDPAAPGFLSRGPLRYVGESYLGFPDGGLWLKGGTNSPENFFGYAGFDGAMDTGGFPLGQDFLHEYGPHEGDWNPGDPDWSSGGDPNAGRGIIGALNYLSARGVNAVYFLPNNLGGDGQDTFPFVQPFGGDFFNTHYDASRMEQWNVVMEHATRCGILLHLVLAEQESESVSWLGFGFTTERKLYFKNLVAMFGHNLGMKINFCEENSADPGDEYSPAELTEFAEYLAMWDVYDHPLSVHTDADDLGLYDQILGATMGGSWLTTTSAQFHDDYSQQVEAARALGPAYGLGRIVVDQDEQGSPGEGLSNNNAAERRKEVLYDVLLSGGNIEWYCGLTSLPVGGDVDLEDFRTREEMWEYTRIARELLEEYPFWRMQPMDELLQDEAISTVYGGAEVFAEPGLVYLIYFPRVVDTGDLNLNHTSIGQTFTGNWISPRTGLVEGLTYTIPGGSLYDVPSPPFELAEDWIFRVVAR